MFCIAVCLDLHFYTQTQTFEYLRIPLASLSPAPPHPHSLTSSSTSPPTFRPHQSRIYRGPPTDSRGTSRLPSPTTATSWSRGSCACRGSQACLRSSGICGWWSQTTAGRGCWLPHCWPRTTPDCLVYLCMTLGFPACRGRVTVQSAVWRGVDGRASLGGRRTLLCECTAGG